jgi:enoyl-CoA hydratase
LKGDVVTTSKSAPPPIDPGHAGDPETHVTSELVELLPGAHAAIVRLNRPDLLNAMTWEMVRELESVLKQVGDDPSVCTVLITGVGRAFSAGGDLKKYQQLQKDAKGFPEFVDDVHRVFGSLATMRQPVVALINGVTAAGGLELALSADFAYIAASARIGDLHLNFAQMGGGGVLSLLPRMIGPAKARELIMSASLLDAQQALDWGLVNRLVPDDQLLEAGLEFARKTAAMSATALANAKYVLNTGFADGTGLPASLRLERERNCLYVLTQPDAHEGLAAFAEKRPPRFQ